MEQNDNRSILARLEQQQKLLADSYLGTTIALIGGAACGNLIFAAFGAISNVFLLRRVEKIARIQQVALQVLETYSSSDVQIFPLLDVPGCNPLDLLVYIPTYAIFIISIRSMGKSKIILSEKTEKFLVKRSHKGFKEWKPDPLIELGLYTDWVKENKATFGMSTRQFRKPVVKILAIAGDTKIDKHNSHLYTHFEEEIFLAPKITGKGTVFVIKLDQVVNFMKAFLASKTKELTTSLKEPSHSFRETT